MQPVSLQRNLGLPLLVLFGLGNILGAGIYVLVGKVAGEAGYFAPLGFLVAAIVAAFSALAYAELSARFPDAGGEVVYLDKAFGIQVLSLGVGSVIVMAGLLSAAAIARGFAGYVQVFWDVPTDLVVVLALLVLGAVAAWGVRQSLLIAAVLTVAEIAGLLLVVVPASAEPAAWLAVTDHWTSGLDAAVLGGVLSGAFLAFYAFIGFEDMVNLAEEARNPQRDMPRAIVLALVVSTTMYAWVVWMALAYMTPDELANSNAPLADVYQRVTGGDPRLLTLIAVFAVINGALVQIIMVSRLLYGMGRRSRWFRVFRSVNATTRTPVRATLLATAVVAILATSLPIQTLAEYTSGLVLVVFLLVNASLIRIRQSRQERQQVLRVPTWIPVAGIVLTASLLAYTIWTTLLYP